MFFTWIDKWYRNWLRLFSMKSIWTQYFSRIATKPGNSGKIREFYVTSKKIWGKWFFKKARENQGSFKFRIVSEQWLSPRSITHRIKSENRQSFSFCMSFCSVQSLWSAVLCVMKPKLLLAKNRVKALPNLISFRRSDKILLWELQAYHRTSVENV